MHVWPLVQWRHWRWTARGYSASACCRRSPVVGAVEWMTSVPCGALMRRLLLFTALREHCGESASLTLSSLARNLPRNFPSRRTRFHLAARRAPRYLRGMQSWGGIGSLWAKVVRVFKLRRMFDWIDFWHLAANRAHIFGLPKRCLRNVWLFFNRATIVISSHKAVRCEVWKIRYSCTHNTFD